MGKENLGIPFQLLEEYPIKVNTGPELEYQI